MKYWKYLSLFMTLIVFGLIIGIFLYYNNLTFASLSSIDNRTYEGQINKEAINVFIISDDNNIGKQYSNYFLDSKPYNMYKDKFNFIYSDNISIDCELYRNIAVLCYSEKVSKSSDYIVVIDNSFTSNIRSSAYLNMISLNAKHPKTVLLHEFGHVLGGLSDEYIPSQLPLKATNCVNDCSKFNNLNDGCFQGCAQNNLYRSIDNGVMKTLNSNDYGTYDNSVIENKIISFKRSILIPQTAFLPNEIYIDAPTETGALEGGVLNP
jgi:hypothetical protein